MGVAASKKGFDELGISVRDGAGNLKPVEELFSEVATRLAEVSNAAQRAAIASELFGRNWAGISSLVNEGGGAIDAARARAESLGVVLSETNVDALAKLKSGFSDLGAVISADFEKVVAHAGDSFAQFTALALEAEKGARSFFEWASKVPDAVTAPDMDATIATLHKSIDDISSQLIELDLKRTAATSAENAAIAVKIGLLKSEMAAEQELLENAERNRHAMDPAAPVAPKPPSAPVADPSVAADAAKIKQSYDDLVVGAAQAAHSQDALRQAIQQGSAAVDAWKVATAGAAAVQKLADDAVRDHVTVTYEQAAAVDLAARDQETATIAAEHQKQATDALTASSRESYDALLKLGEGTDGLTKKQQELADAVGKVWEAYNLGIIKTLPAAEAQITQLQTAVDASSKDTEQIVSAVARGTSSFLSDIVKLPQAKDPVLALANAFEGLAQDIEKAVMQALVLKPILASLGIDDNGKLGSSGFLPSLISGGFKSLFSYSGGGTNAAIQAGDDALVSAGGFQTGGSFDVGGTGGPDSQRVGFMATPGEHVAVNPPGTGKNNGDVNVQIINNHPTAQPSVQSTNGRGGKSIIVQIDEALAYGVSTGRSQLATTMQQTGIGNPRTPITR